MNAKVRAAAGATMITFGFGALAAGVIGFLAPLMLGVLPDPQPWTPYITFPVAAVAVVAILLAVWREAYEDLFTGRPRYTLSCRQGALALSFTVWIAVIILSHILGARVVVLTDWRVPQRFMFLYWPAVILGAVFGLGMLGVGYAYIRRRCQERRGPCA